MPAKPLTEHRLELLNARIEAIKDIKGKCPRCDKAMTVEYVPSEDDLTYGIIHCRPCNTHSFFAASESEFENAQDMLSIKAVIKPHVLAALNHIAEVKEAEDNGNR